MKAWNPQQLDDAGQVAVIEEDPSPVSTDESNEELALHPSRSPTGCCKFCLCQMVVTEKEHLPSDRQQGEAMIVTKDNCPPPYPELSGEESEQITSTVTSSLRPMVSTEMSPSVRDDGSMMGLAERDQHQARLKLGLLKTNTIIKLYVKACGRPKHTWPSQNKKEKQCS